jgi:general secretion pathway protein L
MGQRTLGLDIGATAVRAVVVDATHRSWTVAASVQVAVAPASEGGPSLRERQLEAVRALVADPQLAHDSSFVALPEASATHVITLPFTDPRRIQQTAGFEVEAQIPFDLAEVSWDWQTLQEREGRSELLVAVVKKEELSWLLTGLAAAGVDPRAVIPPAPAYASLLGAHALAFEGTEPGAPSVHAVLDVGASRTSLCVVNGDHCEAARTFAGGASVAPAAVVREVRATLRAWRGRNGGAAVPIRRLFLACDPDRFPALADALAADVEGGVVPLALDGPAAAGISADQAGAMSLALALALRGQQPARTARLNLRRGEFAYTRDFEHVRGKVVRVGAWAALVIVIGLVSSGVKVFALSRHEKLLDGALCDATQKLVGKCYTNDELAVAALRGKGTAAAAIPKNSAVDIFVELAGRTPQEFALRYDRIEITRDKLHLQGLTDAAENVDKIVASLRSSRCFGDARSGGARRRSSDGKFEFTIDSDLTCDTGEKSGSRS